ncbi:hypothetical protein BDN70DRAFT_575549 [Pholiota conissans]|uniref:Uncharacterized protein n=1 Tax=Pholiota conissans TaxID=109636 RepID=A0A9P5YLB2_9AGAR|nr:hypothetical protein BDN70DRAFT_575549 [Pholiota conissans]
MRPSRSRVPACIGVLLYHPEKWWIRKLRCRRGVPHSTPARHALNVPVSVRGKCSLSLSRSTLRKIFLQISHDLPHLSSRHGLLLPASCSPEHIYEYIPCYFPSEYLQAMRIRLKHTRLGCTILLSLTRF